MLVGFVRACQSKDDADHQHRTDGNRLMRILENYVKSSTEWNQGKRRTNERSACDSYCCCYQKSTHDSPQDMNKLIGYYCQ